MTFMDELKSGKFSIYGQWGGWLSALLCIIIGISLFISIPIFAIISIVEGAFLVLLEFTFLAKCIRGTDRIIALSSNNKLKAGIYVVFAVVLWLSLLQSATSLIVAALVLSFTAICYIVAIVKGEESSKSNVVTQEGLARSALSRV